MITVLIISSLVSALIAGVAALFAPCCITVLLPAYFSSIFKQKKTVLLMTFVFFLGLLTVFLPLGLGIAAIGQFFNSYHDEVFIAGGIFLLVLGASILMGFHFSLPFSHPKVKVKNAGSVFVLGIFSAFATLCCAPVLAGVLALSILPGSIFWGGLYAAAYVLGMVLPLFIIAYFLDRIDFANKFGILQKQFSYAIIGKKISITVADIISGIMFLFMGIIILYLAFAGKLAMGGGSYQTNTNIFLENINSAINGFVTKNLIFVILLLIFMASFIIIKLKKRMNSH